MLVLQTRTYVFYCTVHGPEMTGTVTVNANGTTTTTMTTGSTTEASPSGSTPQSTPSSGPAPQTPTGSSGLSSPGSLLAGSPATAIKLAAGQRGQAVHGSIEVSPLGAGGRLELQLLATRASLASARQPARLQVGRTVRSSLPAGTVTFAVALSAKARHALRVHRRLSLTVKIMLSSAHGPSATITRSVVVHA